MPSFIFYVPLTRHAHVAASESPLLVEIGPEGLTPTQQPPEFTPFLRSLSRGSYYYFYLSEERKHWNL
jgi:hypothetical protein